MKTSVKHAAAETGFSAAFDDHTTLAAERNPNVVLINVDDLGYGDLG